MLWHYTTLTHFLDIDRDGEIRLATAFVPQSERPIVWFSKSPNWEPTATKKVVVQGRLRDATLAEMAPLVRIGVAEDPERLHPWVRLKKLANMSRKTARGLERAALDMQAHPGDWWGAFSPIARGLWRAVEISLDGLRWTALGRGLKWTAPDQTDDMSSNARPEVLRSLQLMHDDGTAFRADVINLVDEHTGEHYANIWGERRLQGVAASGSAKVTVLELSIFPETDELEAALALCQVVKGSYTYRAAKA